MTTLLLEYNIKIWTFCVFEKPKYLHSERGREFFNTLIRQLKPYWQALKLINGHLFHTQSEESVKRSSQNVENMSWLNDNS